MSDEHKTAHDAAAPEAVTETAPAAQDHVVYHDRPAGWKYKSYRIFGKEIWYASPKCQLLMISFVCFLCPGMYNSLTGLGGGGQVDPSVQNKAATGLYSTFAVVGFFAGTITNWLGLRPALTVGGLGYCIYAASFLSFNHNKNEGFVIFAGTFLGVCAGLLWCAQGAIMMAYPTEEKKGRYISWFWVIFNLGAVIGALIPLGQNVQNKGGSVNDGTYIAFIVLMLVGAILAMLLCNADDVIREDSTKVIVMKNPSFKSEFVGLWQTLIQDPWVITLFPMFFASNIFYTYQTNDYNSYFNIRARSLNNVLYWAAQIFGAVLVGYLLDIQSVRRSVRAKVALVALLVVTMGIWGGGYAWQKNQLTRDERAALESKLGPDAYLETLVDWTDGGERYIAPALLYFFYGLYDSLWQVTVYWYMGALSNSSRKAANLAGFYKGIQSAGAAIYWALDLNKTSYMAMFGSTWGLLAGSLLIAAPLIFYRIQDHVSMEEDLKFSDETIEDVVVGGKHLDDA